MKTAGISALCLIVLLAIAVLGCATVADTVVEPMRQEPPRMLPDELKARLDDPSLVIIDGRADLDEEGGLSKVKGAVLEIYNEVGAWAPKYPKDKTIVLYCA